MGEILDELIDEVIRSETMDPSIPAVVLDTINDVISEGNKKRDVKTPPPDYDGGEAALTKGRKTPTSQETQELKMEIGEESDVDSSGKKRESPTSQSPRQPATTTSEVTSEITVNGKILEETKVTKEPSEDSAPQMVNGHVSSGKETEDTSSGVKLQSRGSKYEKKSETASKTTESAVLRPKEGKETPSSFSRQVSFFVTDRSQVHFCFFIFELGFIFI